MTTFAQKIKANEIDDRLDPCKNCKKYFEELVEIQNNKDDYNI